MTLTVSHVLAEEFWTTSQHCFGSLQFAGIHLCKALLRAQIFAKYLLINHNSFQSFS